MEKKHKIMAFIVFFTLLFGCAGVQAAELPPAAKLILEQRAEAEQYKQNLPPAAKKILTQQEEKEQYKQSLPPAARKILFGDDRDSDLNENESILAEEMHDERDEAPILTEGNLDELPYAKTPTENINDFFLQFKPKEHIPRVVTPRNDQLLPDTSNIHIRIDYDGTEPCFAEINSMVSNSVLPIDGKELVLLSSKFERGREYHLRVRAGNAYSDTVAFHVGNTREDEIARIIANTDIVAVGPRIAKSAIFPNGIFTSKEEADANMTTITVKVWRANARTVEVDEIQVVDEITHTIRVPVKKFLDKDGNLTETEDIYGLKIHGSSTNAEDGTEATTTEGAAETVSESVSVSGDPEENAEAETEAPEGETSDDTENNDEAEVSDTDTETEAEIQTNTEQTEITTEGSAENQDEPVTDKEGRVTVEEYTEITTIEYVTKVVKRTVNQGDLYSSTASITVNRALAGVYTDIFNDLYEIKFPISSVGCYSWRNTRGGRLSEHALGTAIDINYEQNYCIYSDGSTTGDYWRPYEDIYSVTPEVVNIFRKHNFSWGGSWVSPKDYMHFSYFGT